ncbi:MAG: polysaccharide deacetylase family protein [Candidatus Sulfotelmatobacter sp.]
MAEPSIVFLMYHELEEPGRTLCHPEPGYVRYVLLAADFQAQMKLLQNQGWRGVSMSEAIGFPNYKAVAITFDDGSETDLICAAPVLRQLGFGATFYITAGWLGQRGYLSPGQLRELSALGFEIGCHSMTHAYLTDLDEHGLQREIAEAKSHLEQVIGRPVEHFSCPGGRFDQRVAQVAGQAGYRTVATSQIRANSKSTAPFALGRIAVMRSTSLPAFLELCSGRGLWLSRANLQLREAARKLLRNSLYDRVRGSLLRHGPPR